MLLTMFYDIFNERVLEIIASESGLDCNSDVWDVLRAMAIDEGDKEGKNEDVNSSNTIEVPVTFFKFLIEKIGELVKTNEVLQLTSTDRKLVIIDNSEDPTDGWKQTEDFVLSLAKEKGVTPSQLGGFVGSLERYFLDMNDDGDTFGKELKLGDSKVLILVARHNVEGIGMVTIIDVVDITESLKYSENLIGNFLTDLRNRLSVIFVFMYLLEQNNDHAVATGSKNYQIMADAINQVREIIDQYQLEHNNLQNAGLTRPSKLGEN
ncbi:MAG: hypothetical protein ABFQ62_05380 [Patescibacteria group bacterium]